MSPHHHPSSHTAHDNGHDIQHDFLNALPPRDPRRSFPYTRPQQIEVRVGSMRYTRNVVHGLNATLLIHSHDRFAPASVGSEAFPLLLLQHTTKLGDEAHQFLWIFFLTGSFGK